MSRSNSLERGEVDGVVFLRVMRERAEHPADRVAQLAVIVADGLEDFRADALVVGIIDAGDPEPQDVRARLLDHVLREGLVAERLRHFPPLLVEREAMRQHDVERRAPARAAAFEQRGLEPAAMLVGAFEIHHLVVAAVDGALDAGKAGEMERVLEHVGMGRA